MIHYANAGVALQMCIAKTVTSPELNGAKLRLNWG
jgi:hypothetical protein